MDVTMKTILYSLIVIITAALFTGCDTTSSSMHRDGGNSMNHRGAGAVGRTAGNGPVVMNDGR